MVILCGCFISFPRFFKWVRGDCAVLPAYGSRRYADRWYKERLDALESRSRPRKSMSAPGGVELGMIGVTNDIRVTFGPWRMRR